jgi:hypothetical protein
VIRMIDLGAQTSDGDGPRQFAFWNTVSDQFLDYNGTQVWTNEEDLRADLVWHLGAEQADITFTRLQPLVPEWAKVKI